MCLDMPNLLSLVKYLWVKLNPSWVEIVGGKPLDFSSKNNTRFDKFDRNEHSSLFVYSIVDKKKC
jgi:hypothetical protein